MSDTLREIGRISLFIVSSFGTFASFFALKFSATIIFFCFLIISIILLIRASLQKKKKKHEDELQAHLMIINHQLPIFEGFGTHINGLPIPSKMQINLKNQLHLQINIFLSDTKVLNFKITHILKGYG